MHSAAAAQHKGVLFNILPTKRFSMILSSPGIAATPETDTVAPFVQRIEHESYMSAGVSVPLPAAAAAAATAAEPAPGKRRSVSGAPQVWSSLLDETAEGKTEGGLGARASW
jgi:nucleoid-associated protein YgaU